MTALGDLAFPQGEQDELVALLGVALDFHVLSAAVVILPRVVERIGSGVGVPMNHARRWLQGRPALRSAFDGGAGIAAVAGSPAARRYIATRLRSRFGR